MNSEPHLYRGDWEAVVRIAEDALPAAWEIREWIVVVFASCLAGDRLSEAGMTTDAEQVLDRVFKEVPLRSLPAIRIHAVAFANVTLAQVHLANGDMGQALSAAETALRVAEQHRTGLEQGAAHRVLGEVHHAMGIAMRPTPRSDVVSTFWKRSSRRRSWRRRCSPTAASGVAIIDKKIAC